jgi:peroxiredoxin
VTGGGGAAVPVDDGACTHLEGAEVPHVPLAATDGSIVDLHDASMKTRVVLYAYPRTGTPGQDPPGGTAVWNAIPGARGCTPESCAFRDRHTDLRAHDLVVFGVSTQGSDYQKEMVGRLHLPYPVLSDATLAFARALRLPTFAVGAEVFLKRVTLVLSQGRVEKVFYPVYPPEKSAEEVLRWLTAR